MAREIKSFERDYIIWQNRGFRFYLAARLCYRNGLHAAAAYCGQQALEALLKATLVYWDRKFSPEAARHCFSKLLRRLKKKVPGATGQEVPQYFYWEDRFQLTSRYPTKAGSILVPASFLADLDTAFFELAVLVPFQFNSELKHLLSAPDSPKRRILTRENRCSRKLQGFLKVIRKFPHGAA